MTLARRIFAANEMSYLCNLYIQDLSWDFLGYLLISLRDIKKG